MKHFGEIQKLVEGILRAMSQLTTNAANAVGPANGTVLVLISLFLALAFAAFMAGQFEQFVIHVLHEILSALQSAAAIGGAVLGLIVTGLLRYVHIRRTVRFRRERNVVAFPKSYRDSDNDNQSKAA